MTTIQTLSLIPFKMWMLLIAGPAFFLLGLTAASAYFGFRGVTESQISQRVVAVAPHILLGVLVGMAVLMTTMVPQIQAAWQLPPIHKGVTDILIGLGAGLVLAFAYLRGLKPLLEVIQRVLGDYVPPGAVLPTLSGSIKVFLVANVFLAPLVEETLYRGVALPLFSERLGTLAGTVLICGFFGILHWAGGFWYMLLTGFVAGGLFALLFHWRDGILAPYTAHLVLNVVEFIYAWRVHRQS